MNPISSNSSFIELEEISEIIDSIISMQDSVLDIYEKQPEESKKVLLDLSDLKSQAEKLHQSYLNLI
jgi:hypothetical protein